MFRPRIIPVLLLKGSGLVKTVRFSNPTYIGDPINAVRLFNDYRADELVFLDITASAEGRTISKELIKNIGDEAYMPFSVGGGISTTEQIRDLLSCGAEKVVLNTSVSKNLSLVEQASKTFGSQSIIVSVDVRRRKFGKPEVMIKGGRERVPVVLKQYIKDIETAGAGEILINSIDRDGTMEGYDISLIKEVSEAVNIPVIACGGAGSLADMRTVYAEGGASACAAGSLFVFHGSRKGILISYPDKREIANTFTDGV
jgi:cyclase